MKIIQIKEELKEPLESIFKSQRQVKHGILLLTRESEYLQNELWNTLKAEYPDIGDKFAHLDSKKWEVTVFERKGMKTSLDHMVDANVSEVKDIAKDLEERIAKLENMLNEHTYGQ